MFSSPQFEHLPHKSDRSTLFVGSSAFLFPSGVLGTASADIRCARHLRPFCFALPLIFEESPQPSGFGPTAKFKS
jgi:hypothetical protein